MKRWLSGLLIAALLLSMTALAESADSDAMIEELPEMDLFAVLEEEPVAKAGEAEDASDDEAAAPPDETAKDAEPAAAEPVDAADVRMVLNAASLSLGRKETFQLTPVVIPSEQAQAYSFQFSTSNKKIATVSETGLVKAKKVGSATIEALASDGTRLTCEVTVFKAPKSVKLSEKSVTLGYDPATNRGSSFQLVPVLPAKSASIITYEGYDRSVIDVSPDGWVTPQGLGSTKVTVRTYNKKKATCEVKVLPGPASASFDDAATAMCEGEVRKLALRVPEGTIAGARFTSNNPAVVKVDADSGEAEALTLGQASVTAACFNGVTADCVVTVLPGPESIQLSDTQRTLGVGESFTLIATPTRKDGQATAGGLEFVSSKPKVAIVDQNGLVTAKKKGTAKIGVKAANGVYAVCEVKVLRAPSSVRLNAKTVKLTYDANTGLGGTYQLTIKLPSKSSGQVEFTGYDPAVVSLSPGGLLTAVGLGETTVTARAYNGKKATCKVTVTAPGSAGASNYRAMIVAHRGGAGSWPENTAEAFRNAPTTGAKAIELDARTTADGVEVIHHDPGFSLNGTEYVIAKLTVAELKALKPSVCTLDEAIEVISATGLEMHLELKDTADVAKCVEAVRAHGMQGRTMYISFFTNLLEQVRAMEPAAPLGLCFTKTPANLIKTVQRIGIKGVFQKYTKLTKSNLKKWHKAGLQVGVWTVNDQKIAEKWLKAGVDAITSDYPAMVAQLY